ncbi:MAG TPA: bifunctional metallophosphatase/5'-nucleotidase [Calditrichae bacterium]|nr:bifunctional metallophosphatase/5'-nucleotidase [Calditrichia bacterium]
MPILAPTVTHLKQLYASLFSRRTQKLVILYTTDVHGHLYPYDYVRGTESRVGLARAATIIEQYRKKYPHLILLDNGDFLQGSPMTYYYNFINTNDVHPVARAMNALHYQAVSVGNHDIEQGPDVYLRVRKQTRFPWLSANGERKPRGTFFQPYTIREVEGIRVAILGMTTPAIPLWLEPDLYPGITWKDMLTATRHWFTYLKEKKHADVVIGLFHAGVHPNAGTPGWPEGLPEENPCLQIAEAIPQLDVILGGHEHRIFNTHEEGDADRPVDRPLVMMAGSHGRYVGVVTLHLKKEQNTWVVTDKWGHLERVAGQPAHPKIVNILRPYHREVLHYVSSIIGHLEAPLSSRLSRLMDTPFLDFIHQMQFHFTGADLSLAASFDAHFELKPGPIRIKDVYGVYKYENYLYVVEMTGAQFKEHLEWSSQYFHTVDPERFIPDDFINHDFMGFNFDTGEGVDYEIDVTRPVGHRIQNLRLQKSGEPLQPDTVYRVAVNSYRAQQLRQRFHCPVVWKSNKEVRDLMVEYIQQLGTVRPTCNFNWKIVPEWVVEQFIKRRMLAKP